MKHTGTIPQAAAERFCGDAANVPVVENEHGAHGGTSCLNNLVSLCSKHHSLVHEVGFGCEAIKRDKGHGVSIVLSTPRGAIIPEDFALEAVSGEVEQQQLDLNITSYTCVTTDAGSTLDTSVVINALAIFGNVK